MIDCSAIEKGILASLKNMAVPKRKLAAILVGNDKASLSFLQQKNTVASELGINFELIELSSELAQSELESEVRKISEREDVGGVIVQLPLPAHFDRVGVLNAIGIEKDVDVLNGETSRILAPAAGALAAILENIEFNPEGKNAVVIGSGLLIGEPCIKWLMHKTKKLTVFNKGGIDKKTLKKADLIVTGTGVVDLLKGSDIAKGAVVVDFGYGRKDGKLGGDAHAASVLKKTGFLTPVPGGTGPIVVAMLMKNFLELNSGNA